MAHILIAGCGDLGSGIAKAFVAQGHQVTGIRRTGLEFPHGVEGITGDLLEMDEACLPDVALVFLIMTPNGRHQSAYQSAYYDTAQVVIRRYKGMAKPPQIFFVSSTSVYGQSKGEWIDEETLAQPTSETAKVLLDTEVALSEELPSMAVRCSGIYGAGRFKLLEKVANEIEWGANSWTNRVHRDDVVSALTLLAECALTGQALPSHVILTDQTPVSMWEVKLWLATSLGAKIAVNNIQDFLPASGKRLQGQYLLGQGWKPMYPSYVSGYQSLLREYTS